MELQLLASVGVLCRVHGFNIGDCHLPRAARSEPACEASKDHRENQKPKDHTIVDETSLSPPSSLYRHSIIDWHGLRSRPRLSSWETRSLRSGSFFIFFVFRENTFTAQTVEVEAEQTVISTGPYAFVRHPMYVGGLILISGIPLALCSQWWGLLTAALIAPVIAWRLLDEEKVLTMDLMGYAEYRNKVKYRLRPLVGGKGSSLWPLVWLFRSAPCLLRVD